ncbi:MAG: dihydroorotate dehydrogenase electron transfer subunit [Candidatus Magnetomorum sp.]|nr:dihydroorotate dehydrogenase electron transfer subunit [Candidatus Magnetomorum sp.]
MMYQKNARILWNRNILGKYYRIGISCPKGFQTALAGQFVMLRLTDDPMPLLRRPFSIHGMIWDASGFCGIELLYKVVGNGTNTLSKITVDQEINMLGPLGNGFNLEENVDSALIVAGGIGVAPMIFLTKCLLQKGKQCHVHVLYGGQTADDLFCTDIFNDLGVALQLYTEDGSVGKKGWVTDEMHTIIRQIRPDMIYACGPNPMLANISKIAKENEISCRLSLEAHMACGMGACLGCAVASKDTQKRYFHVCKDGPVFDANDIIMQ